MPRCTRLPFRSYISRSWRRCNTRDCLRAATSTSRRAAVVGAGTPCCTAVSWRRRKRSTWVSWRRHWDQTGLLRRRDGTWQYTSPGSWVEAASSQIRSLSCIQLIHCHALQKSLKRDVWRGEEVQGEGQGQGEEVQPLWGGRSQQWDQ